MKRKAIFATCFLAIACLVSFAAAPRWWPNLEEDKNRAATPTADVRALQYLLRSRGYKIGADGVYGKQTANAVRHFQGRHKIVKSGQMNPATWEVLVPKVKLGSRGDAVRAAQTMLRHANYDVRVDGVFGKSTRNAVLKFQKVRDPTRDGILGLNTWCLLAEGSVGEPESD